MINRRGFLAALAASFVADPERLLWVPGAKMISIPKSIPEDIIKTLMTPAIIAIAAQIETDLLTLYPNFAGVYGAGRNQPNHWLRLSPQKIRAAVTAAVSI